MEQIETQASDLRFLAQAQVPLSNSPSVTYETPRPGPQQQGSPGSASFGDISAAHGDDATGGASAHKRKSTDDGLASAKQTRSKRNRVSFSCSSWVRAHPPITDSEVCAKLWCLSQSRLAAPKAGSQPVAWDGTARPAESQTAVRFVSHSDPRDSFSFFALG